MDTSRHNVIPYVRGYKKNTHLEVLMLMPNVLFTLLEIENYIVCTEVLSILYYSIYNVPAKQEKVRVEPQSLYRLQAKRYWEYQLIIGYFLFLKL